jgi:hypothetical protein
MGVCQPRQDHNARAHRPDGEQSRHEDVGFPITTNCRPLSCTPVEMHDPPEYRAELVRLDAHKERVIELHGKRHWGPQFAIAYDTAISRREQILGPQLFPLSRV